MTNLAESLITALPCTPLKRWPFLLYMLQTTWSGGGMGPLLLLLAASTSYSYKILAPQETCQQPVLGFCPVLFPISPRSSGGLIQSHNSKFIIAFDLSLNSTLIHLTCLPDISICMSDRHYKFKTKVLISLPIPSHPNHLLLTTSASFSKWHHCSPRHTESKPKSQPLFLSFPHNIVN